MQFDAQSGYLLVVEQVYPWLIPVAFGVSAFACASLAEAIQPYFTGFKTVEDCLLALASSSFADGAQFLPGCSRFGLLACAASFSSCSGARSGSGSSSGCCTCFAMRV
jgi:hypothetical protein